jgi:hypothetical protein
MRPTLVINGVDFKDWIEEDGIKYSTVDRVKRSVVTLGGTDYRKTIEKDKLDITLLDMPDSLIVDGNEIGLQAVEAALNLARPAIVNYTTKKGVSRTGIAFYQSSISPTAHKVIGDTTYFTGISFTLEER